MQAAPRPDRASHRSPRCRNRHAHRIRSRPRPAPPNPYQHRRGGNTDGQPTHRHHAELGSLENKQAASLAGLAAVARQSGQWKGKSFIRGGRTNVRQALYMPALVAARFNPDLKTKYRQLVEAGKPAKVAITAIMRKLIVTGNVLLEADRLWIKTPA